MIYTEEDINFVQEKIQRTEKYVKAFKTKADEVYERMQKTNNDIEYEDLSIEYRVYLSEEKKYSSVLNSWTLLYNHMNGHE